MNAKPRVRLLIDILEPVSLGISYAIFLAWIVFMIKQTGWRATFTFYLCPLFMAFATGRFTAEKKTADRLVRRMTDLDNRSERHEALVRQAVDLFQGQRLPPGVTCVHPRMRCPSNCGKQCGHFYCPDCGLSWDDGAGK